ncbi:MAG: hypothetical protein M0R37_13435 [Bacteroidales bacterium]|nr:hypothetical protein [Bacteroidales bacterium]
MSGKMSGAELGRSVAALLERTGALRTSNGIYLPARAWDLIRAHIAALESELEAIYGTGGFGIPKGDKDRTPEMVRLIVEEHLNNEADAEAANQVAVEALRQTPCECVYGDEVDAGHDHLVIKCQRCAALARIEADQARAALERGERA